MSAYNSASLPPAFWRAYRELIPEDRGFRKRAKLYELYHRLNHRNLFEAGHYHGVLGRLMKPSVSTLEVCMRELACPTWP